MPHDYDKVMGVVSVGSQESVRFGEEDDSEFKEVEETAAHSQNILEENQKDEEQQPDETTESGELRGGYGSASLKEFWGRYGVKFSISYQPVTGYEPKHGTEPSSAIGVSERTTT